MTAARAATDGPRVPTLSAASQRWEGTGAAVTQPPLLPLMTAGGLTERFIVKAMNHSQSESL